jgi:uncharacterized protein (TIGR02145 family)
MRKFLLLFAVAAFVAFMNSCNTSESASYEVQIGNQIWMAKNLNVDKFRNGDPIPEAKSIEEWTAAGKNGQPAWCYYNNDPSNEANFGKLYNAYAIVDPRGLAPEGWRIPKKADWEQLRDFLGENAGQKLKNEEGWNEGDGSTLKCIATNESDFAAAAGGMRLTKLDDVPLVSFGQGQPDFVKMGTMGYFWSLTSDEKVACTYQLLRNNCRLDESYAMYLSSGYSVRCLKEQ